jgi:tRNA pseudouridine55 synthase
VSDRPRDGLLLVDKPTGPTSHDIVNRVRRASGVRRVGHAGTLDPLASGLLPLVIGRATRLVRFLPAAPKTYTGRLQLGRTTTTDDILGEPLTEHEGHLPTPDRVLAAARDLQGRQSQTPPAFSARRIAGRRLYELARQGVAVEAAATDVEVHRFELIPTDETGVYEFTAEVSSGTYIRALARDLGQALGCGGLLAALQRLRIGPMRLEDAHPLPPGHPDEAWFFEALVPLEQMPLSPPPLSLAGADDARRFGLGNCVPVVGDDVPQGQVRVLHPDGRLLGIGEAQGHEVHPRVVVDPGDAPSLSTEG